MKNYKKNISLLILAGGLGSRYQGAKQTDGIGPNGESLLEYAIFDAIEAGFSKIVLIINAKVEALLKEKLNQFKNKIEINYVHQQFVLANQHQKRVKPWGTGHAVLMAKNTIKEPFMVMNADDYYGQTTLKIGADFLNKRINTDTNMAMIGFKLNNTLSENGTVSRGVCSLNSNNTLVLVEEHESIEKKGNIIFSNKSNQLPPELLVSMNCWLLTPAIFDKLALYFNDFFEQNKDTLKNEFYLPSAIQRAINEQDIEIEVLESKEKWFGLTYAADKTKAVATLNAKIEQGDYPSQLV